MAARHHNFGLLSSIRALHAFWVLARLNNASLPLVGLSVGFGASGSHDTRILLFAAISLVLVHSVITVWNDICDEAGDIHNGIDRLSELRALGLYDSMRHWLYVFTGVSIVSLWLLPVWSSLLLVLLGFLGWLYNSSPVQASRRPIASIILLAWSYGGLPVLLGMTLGDTTILGVGLVVAWTLGRGSLSILKDYKDAAGDARSNKRTFLLRFGGTLTAQVSIFLGIVSSILTLLVLGFFIQLPIVFNVLLIVVSVWLVVVRLRLRSLRGYVELNRLFHRCVEYQLLFDGLVAACLLTR